MRKSNKKPASFSALFSGISEAATAATTPATEATPATDKAADKAAQAEMLAAARAVSKTAYNGASLAIRSGNPKLAKLLDNISVPKQCTDAISQRDRSYLRGLRTTYAAYVNLETGAFDPVVSHLDAGVASHLGHHKLATVRDGAAYLTPAGLKQLATA